MRSRRTNCSIGRDLQSRAWPIEGLRERSLLSWPHPCFFPCCRESIPPPVPVERLSVGEKSLRFSTGTTGTARASRPHMRKYHLRNFCMLSSRMGEIPGVPAGRKNFLPCFFPCTRESLPPPVPVERLSADEEIPVTQFGNYWHAGVPPAHRCISADRRLPPEAFRKPVFLLSKNHKGVYRSGMIVNRSYAARHPRRGGGVREAGGPAVAPARDPDGQDSRDRGAKITATAFADLGFESARCFKRPRKLPRTRSKPTSTSSASPASPPATRLWCRN